MATILLSIKPEYADLIFSGRKKYEFRKHLPRKNVDRIVVYSTSPVQRVIGEVQVLGSFAMTPDSLWEMTKGLSGISQVKYREYFKECTTAYAFQLGQTQLYEAPKTLEEMALKSAPQSFVYLDED